MPATIQDVKATALSAPTVAIIVTALRIFERIRTRKFGIDDAFALLSAIMLLVLVVCMFIYLDAGRVSRTTGIALFYILSELFYAILWCTRLSILFSIMRISPGFTLRRILYGLAVAFVICWAILFAQEIWTCENEPGWKDEPSRQCALGSKVAVAQIITDVFADTTLIMIPVRLLWNLRVSKGQRIRLLLTFSASIITTIVSLVHAYYLLRVGGPDELVAAIVENAVSLIVCSTPVIVTSIMHLIGYQGESDSPSRRDTSAFPNAKDSALPLSAINFVSKTSFHMSEGGFDEEIVQDQHNSPKWNWPSEEGVHITREEVIHFTPKPE